MKRYKYDWQHESPHWPRILFKFRSYSKQSIREFVTEFRHTVTKLRIRNLFTGRFVKL